MEWKETEPEQKNRLKQWDLTAYLGAHKIGSIFLDNDNDFNSIIDGNEELLNASNLDEAKEEFYNSLEAHIHDKIDYYKDLLNNLQQLIIVQKLSKN